MSTLSTFYQNFSQKVFLNVDFVYFIDSISGSTASYDNTDLKNCPYIKLVQIVKINGK